MKEKTILPQLTRRDFIKTTAVLSGAVGVGLGIDGRVLNALAESATPATLGEEKITYNQCPGDGCHQRCILACHTRDGRMFKTVAYDYPEEPRQRHSCLKALTNHRWVYAPDRLKYPMKRVGERGSGQWERISWDEALDTIANKIRDTKENYGIEHLYFKFGGSSGVGNLGCGGVSGRLFNLVGSGGGVPRGYTTDGGPPAAKLRVFGDSRIGGNSLGFINSKLVVEWGGNVVESAKRVTKHILEARETGTRLITVGVIFDPTAAMSDQFIGVRLATDGALAMSMINTIVEEGLYDADYVKKYTCGPLLVRSDNKMFLRESDIVTGGSEENYIVWDTVTNAPVVMPPKTHQVADVDPALLGTYSPEGIECKTAFQLLANKAAEYPLDVASEITGTPQDTIRDFAIEYATTKPACIDINAGMVRHLHGNLGCRAVCTLAALTGNVGVRGGGPGGHGGMGSVSLNTRGVSAPPKDVNVGNQKVPGARCEMDSWIDMREGRYPIPKVVIWGFKNSMQAYGNYKNYVNILQHSELIVSIDVFPAMTTEYADIILPDASLFERTDLLSQINLVVYAERAIEPLWECRPNYEIFAELGNRLGLGEYFTKTPDEWVEIMLDSGHPSVAGITLKRLRSEGPIRANIPNIPSFRLPVTYEDKIFPTASGRIEFYSEILIPYGEELPFHKENLESPRTSPLAAQYPLSFMTKRKRYFSQTAYSNIDWIGEVAGTEAVLDINPVDAEARGIADRDVVRVFNDRGYCKVKARLQQGVPPGLVNIDHGWKLEHHIEGHYNHLLFGIDDPETINPVLVLPDVMANNQAAQHTLIYDCLVEVEKAEVNNG